MFLSIVVSGFGILIKMKYSWVAGTCAEATHRVPTNITDKRFFGEDHTKHMETQLHYGSPTKKVKRFRSAFTTDQVNYLEQEFRKFPYIGNGQRKEVAIALNIPERAVKIWFQNRRMREKKEVSNKEFVDEQTSCKTPEFDKDQLFNVRTQQSSNEHPSYSLPLLTDAVDSVNKSNIDNSTAQKRYRVVIKQPVKANYYEETCLNKSQNITSSTKSVDHDLQYNASKQRSSPLDHKSSAEFSINLCKRYKKESDNLPRKQQNDQDVSLHQTNYKYQETPEDLSSKKQNASREEPNRLLRNTPCLPLVSNYYPQSFVPPGGVVWKAINIMPYVPTGGPAMTLTANDSGNLSVVHEQNVQKKICNCDCHGKTYPIPIAYQQSSQSPQYIITAMPFQNTSQNY